MAKRPTWKEQPPTQKIPKSVAISTYHEFRPSWRVGDMVLSHDELGFHEIDGAALHPADHFLPVDKMSKEAQVLLEQSGVGDVDEVVSLRVGKKCRLWGIMQPFGTLLILWWDPKHLVYPMNIKDN